MRISDWSSDVCSSDLLRPPQVHHILTDCNVRVLVTSRERLLSLGSLVERCPDLRYVVLIDAQEDDAWPATSSAAPTVLSWSALQRAAAPGSRRHPRTIDIDMAAILYTSGRSEEHTSELQSLMRISSAVFCLKNKHTINKRLKLT